MVNRTVQLLQAQGFNYPPLILRASDYTIYKFNP